MGSFSDLQIADDDCYDAIAYKVLNNGGTATRHDYDGAFIVGRFEFPGQPKQIANFGPDGSAGLPAQFNKPKSRPLYNKRKVVQTVRRSYDEATGGRVVVVEGETCVEVARRVFPNDAVTTWSGGVQSYANTDWSPLVGKEVILIADHDGDGRRAMKAIGQMLRAKPYGCSARVYYRPGEDKVNNDIADWLAPDAGELAVDELRAEIEGSLTLPKDVPLDDDTGADTAGEAVTYRDIEPWDEPVDGGEVLSALSDLIGQYINTTPENRDTVALWCAMAHMHSRPEIEVAPFLHITSATKQCGKSNLLQVVSAFVPRPEITTNLSKAYMFRLIQMAEPTLLIDELDRLLKRDDEEFIGMLNGSQLRATAYVGRVEPLPNGQGFALSRFKVWCPKVLCGIGTLPETTADRCLRVLLERRKPQHEVLWRDRDTDAVRVLARKLRRWCLDNADAVIACRRYVDIPETLNDRQADSWELLLAIGECAEGDWPERAEDACKALCESGNGNRDMRELLITDMRAVFEYHGDPAVLPTGKILAALNSMDERRWPTYRRGKPMNAETLRFLLRDFETVRPFQKRIEDKNLRCYALVDVGGVAARYPATSDDNPLDMLHNSGSGLGLEPEM